MPDTLWAFVYIYVHLQFKKKLTGNVKESSDQAAISNIICTFKPVLEKHIHI